MMFIQIWYVKHDKKSKFYSKLNFQGNVDRNTTENGRSAFVIYRYIHFSFTFHWLRFVHSDEACSSQKAQMSIQIVSQHKIEIQFDESTETP